MKLNRGAAIPVLCALFLLLWAYVVFANGTSEEDIRSAVIVAMLRFTTWEEEDSSKNELRLCSYGAPLSESRLNQGIKKAPSFGKNLQHTKLETLEKHSACDVIILGPKSDRVLGEEVLRNKLSICDGCTINKNTVIAELKLIADRIKFNINLESADKAGIKLSSDLLILANKIRRKRENGQG